jgi:hypothetical protein
MQKRRWSSHSKPHTPTLSAQRLADEIESIEEMSMADLVTIARSCGAALQALNTLKTKLTVEEEPQPPTPATALKPSPLSLVNSIAA